MSAIIRHGVPWERRAPGVDHYSIPSPEDGGLTLHANNKCSHVNAHGIRLSSRIVDTLWEKDVTTSTASSVAGENDVMWCENCASKRSD
ncbi:hypothetical protein ACOCJ5_03175 [Knoellia sp. CPCC 206450]|uniref:hypothetical protein n=1 Tax=Knoellia tibetensis TaxID=3404798 RepID=UPI003B4305D1